MCPLASSSSSRWCPTPDQLMILEEMYKAGVRTPSASQIQKVTAHLSVYGKIEGKNVFYWFQNHKARDRQKLRRKLSKQLIQHQLFHHQFPVSSFFHVYPPVILPAVNSYIIPPEGEHLMMLQNWKGGHTMDTELNQTMKMDSPACRAKRPVETLQLFPTTCTNLKQDRGLPR